MASCFYLLQQFEDVIVYLNSIKVCSELVQCGHCYKFLPSPSSFLNQSYFFNVDSFNYNFAQAKAVTGSYQEAEEIFLLINSEKIKNDYIYISWLARCCESTIILSHTL